MEGETTFVFDCGMHPVIKEAFLSVSNNPVFINEEHNELLKLFILRNMLVQHSVGNEGRFKVMVNHFIKNGRISHNDCFVISHRKYYDLELAEQYYKDNGEINPLSNNESKRFREMLKKYKKEVTQDK